MTILGEQFGFLQVHPKLPEDRRSDREVILLLHGLGGSSADWAYPQWRGYEYDHEHSPPDRHNDNNLTPPLLPFELSLADKRPIRCWSGILRGLGHTVIHYSQDGNQDVAETPLRQLEELIVPYIRDTVLVGPLAGKRVTVLAHSRGGILIRYYLARHPDESDDWIGRVITLHSPHSGSLAPEAKRRLADWVVTHLLGPDPISFLAGQLVLTLIDSLTDWLDSTPGQSQLLPGNPLFNRLWVPADTPSIDFHTFGGSSVTMSPIYHWEWTPGSYINNWWDFPDIRYDWTQFATPLLPIPLLDLVPNDAVFPEEWEGRGDIAVTLESSRLAGSDHRDLAINHAEALFDERLFELVAGLLGTPLGAVEAIGCGMGFLGNSRTMELHSLESPTRQCQIAEIVEPEFFDSSSAALESGYDGCFYCMRAEHTPENS